MSEHFKKRMKTIKYNLGRKMDKRRDSLTVWDPEKNSKLKDWRYGGVVLKSGSFVFPDPMMKPDHGTTEKLLDELEYVTETESQEG